MTNSKRRNQRRALIARRAHARAGAAQTTSEVLVDPRLDEESIRRESDADAAALLAEELH